MKFFSPENFFNAEGLTQLKTVTETRRRDRNSIVRDNDVAIAQKDLEARQQTLTIELVDWVLNLSIATRTNVSGNVIGCRGACADRRWALKPFSIGEIHMKYFLSALIAIGFSFAAAPSFAADSRNVSVVNETGYAIKFLGFNGPDDGMDEWDNELDKVLQNQATTYVEFDDDDEGCVWNVRVDWQNYNESVLWKNVNLCKFNVLRLRYDSGTKTTSFIAE